MRWQSRQPDRRPAGLQMLADGRFWNRWDDDKWEPVEPIRSMWQCFRVLRVKHRKASLTRWPIACAAGGRGLSSHRTPVMGLRKQTVNTHSRSVIRPTLRTARISYFRSKCSTPRFYNNCFGSGEEDWQPGPIPGDTIPLRTIWKTSNAMGGLGKYLLLHSLPTLSIKADDCSSGPIPL
jgi:hypothetical protein